MKQRRSAGRPGRGAAFLVGAALLFGASEASADEEEVGIGVAIVSLAAVDLSFSVRAAVLAANEGDAQFEYSLAQSLVAAPQALAFNAAMVAFMGESDAPGAFAALHIPATMTTALAVHGLWSLASPDEDQAFMFLASTAIGVNTMWTSFVLGTATASRNRFDDGAPIVGVYEAITTLPGVAIGIHQALETDRFTAGWIGIAGWSGLLALHGALFAADVTTPEYSYPTAAVVDLGISPASLGAPVEGAPDTPGLIVSGAF